MLLETDPASRSRCGPFRPGIVRWRWRSAPAKSMVGPVKGISNGSRYALQGLMSRSAWSGRGGRCRLRGFNVTENPARTLSRPLLARLAKSVTAPERIGAPESRAFVDAEPDARADASAAT